MIAWRRYGRWPARLCCALAIGAAAAAPVPARADLCRLILEAETDAAEAGDGHAPDAAEVSARLRKVAAALQAEPRLRSGLMALARPYRALSGAALPVGFRDEVLAAARVLRRAKPACALADPPRVLNGAVVTPRPPASTGAHDRTPPEMPGGLAPSPVPQPVFDAAREERLNSLSGPVVVGFVVLSLVALWVHWRFVARPGAAKRHACHLPAQITAGRRTEESVVEDISQYWARIRRGPAPLAEGMIVTVRCAQFERAGRVQWTNATYAGLRFRKPLRAGVVAACATFRPQVEQALADAGAEAAPEAGSEVAPEADAAGRASRV